VKAKLLSGLLALITLFCQAAELHVYNWANYMPKKLLTEFSQETGITVYYSTYSSNEALFAKLELLDGRGYDLIFPSSYYIAKLAGAKLIQPLDKSRLSNLHQLDPMLMNRAFDPGNRYSIPFMWGSTGIAVNHQQIPKHSIVSWKQLWDERWRNQLQLPDDVRDMFQIALTILGHPANTDNPKYIREAFILLRALIPNVAAFVEDNHHAPFVTGDVAIGVVWNAEVKLANQQQAPISYIYPEEGAVFWSDSMAIPIGANNPQGAYAFIDFLLRPENAKLLVEEIGYATPNRGAMALLDKQTLADPAIFPPPKLLEQGRFLAPISDATYAIYQKYWRQLKALR